MKRLNATIAALLFVCSAAAASGALAARRPAMPEDHTSQWQWLHGKAAVEDLARCQKCHTGDSCKTCHLADWPHPEGFLRNHGTEALRLKGKGCYLCHRPSYCDPCHQGVRMPHPEGYLQMHVRSKFDQASCAMCHSVKQCESCHKAHASHRSEGAQR
jgi:hypothetical protein